MFIVVKISLTWFQFFFEPIGSFFHRFTSSTQALQISPVLLSLSLQRVRVHSLVKMTLELERYNHVTGCSLPEAAREVLLVAPAVSEARAGRLGAADAAAVQTPVHLRLVEAEHLPTNRHEALYKQVVFSFLNEYECGIHNSNRR